MQTFPLSLVVMTFNEAHTIARCLDSVPFAAEKLVIDCGSTDDTVAIAQACGARVIHQDWLGFGPQRNFAQGQAGHDWILALDADEYLSPALVEEMMAALPALQASDKAAAWLRRSLIYMGAPMRWYRPAVGERMARLYHRDRARWRDVRVHESLEFKGRAAELKAPFYHLNNRSLLEKQLKVLRYSELKCLDWRDRGKPVRMWQSPWVFGLAFFKDYVLRLGMLDGWRGFTISQTAASYALYKRMRYFEMKHDPDSVATAATALRRHQLDR